MCAVGGIGWYLCPVGKPVFIAITVLGAFWTLLVGHALEVSYGVVRMPIIVACGLLFLPLKQRGDTLFWNGYRILAYLPLPDRIVLVRYFPSLHTVGGQSLFRRKALLDRTLAVLNTAEVSAYHAVNESTLRQCIEHWNQNTRLVGWYAEHGIWKPLGKEPVLCLEARLEAVDRIHRAISFLWQENEGTADERNVIQLAMWCALVEDKVYGFEKMSPLVRLLYH